MLSEKKLKEESSFMDEVIPKGFRVKEIEREVRGVKQRFVHVYKNGVLDKEFRFWDQAWFYLENQ